MVGMRGMEKKMKVWYEKRERKEHLWKEGTILENEIWVADWWMHRKRKLSQKRKMSVSELDWEENEDSSLIEKEKCTIRRRDWQPVKECWQNMHPEKEKKKLDKGEIFFFFGKWSVRRGGITRLSFRERRVG